MTGIRFSWGPGPGHRLLSPGLPDALYCSGQTIGWQGREGLYLWFDHQVHLFPFGDIGTVCPSPSVWVVQVQVGDEWHITHISPQLGHARTWVSTARAVTAGARWVVVDGGIERSVIDIETEEPVLIPVGARDAHPRPWPCGPGLTWLDGATVYRMDATGRTRVAGSLPDSPLDWATGPCGAAAFALKEEFWVLPPKGPPAQTEAIDLASVRFSPDGETFIATSSEAAVHGRTADGGIIDRIPGAWLTVGFRPDPLLLDEDSGVLRTWDGAPVRSGFAPSAVARADHLLFGPGGTAWDLRTGERMWDHSPLEGDHLCVTGEQIISVGDRVEIFGLDGKRRVQFALPVNEDVDGPVYSVCAGPDQHLFFEVGDGWVMTDLAGRRIQTLAELPITEQDDSTSEGWSIDADGGVVLAADGAFHWPIVADGIAQHSGRLWCWNEDGLLCALELNPADA